MRPGNNYSYSGMNFENGTHFEWMAIGPHGLAKWIWHFTLDAFSFAQYCNLALF